MISLPLPFLLIFSFFPFLSSSTSSSTSLIQQTCKNCSKTDPNISYKFCTSSLQAAPKSPCADTLRELGIIPIKLTRHNVTHTSLRIEELLKDKKLGPFVKSCLNDCHELYSDAIEALREAIRDYRAKRYDDANIKISSVADAATTCEDGFKEKKGVVSPLTKMNNDTFQLSAISLSIINMLNIK